MSTSLMEREPAVVAVTGDQIELIKRTVAAGATADELKLYLYDCQRQGVHPLDKLIHFTKRGGKYTPITSIDFMRTRAADTNEYAGSDDARFESGTQGQPPLWATVKVYRLVQGQKCSFEATARWAEYCPASGQDHMWRKMPHTMLAKCAEALALRKGFPRQLAGLYAKEEMDQADTSHVVSIVPAPPATVLDASTGAEVPASAQPAAPEGYHYIHGYKKTGDWHEFALLDWDQQGGAFTFSTKLDSIGGVIQQAYQQGVPIKVTSYTAKKNNPRQGYVNKLEVYKAPPTNAEIDAELARKDMARLAGDVF